MKKLKKCDFKKLALMGMAGGTLLASQGNAAQMADNGDYSNMLAMGCSSRSGCSGSQPASYGYNQGQSNQNSAYGYNAPTQMNGCSGQNQPNWAQNTPPAANTPAPSYYYTDAQGQWQQGTPPQSYVNPQGATQQQGQPVQPGAQGQMGTQPNNPQAYNNRNGQGQSRFSANTSSTNAGKLTESQLQSQLNDQAKSTFQSMDAQGKALALKLANQDCKGQNDCKGLNSCKTEEHSCAGKGSCAGTSKGPFQDKNLAVKVAAMKMAEKRSSATSPR